MTREEAVWVKRPNAPEVWSWSESIQAIVQDSHKFDLPWTRTLEIIEGCLNNLYDRGFEIVKAKP